MLFLALFLGLSLLLPPAEALRATAWSLLPPLLAIGLALWARQVVISLFLGIWLGASMLAGNPFSGFLRVVDTNIRQSLVNSDHISILVFSVLLGGMVVGKFIKNNLHLVKPTVHQLVLEFVLGNFPF